MKAVVNKKVCVACGCCAKVCRKNAIQIINGVYALIDTEKCVGCGLCVKECPASIITLSEVSST